MGHGRFDPQDWTAYSSSISHKSTAQVFQSSSVPDDLDPRGIKVRESRDSAQNPRSTPVLIAADGTGREELLRLGGALEDASEHPIARAIAAAARTTVSELPAVESFASTQGRGVAGVVDGHAVVAGRTAWLRDEWSLAVPDGLANAQAAAAATPAA